jgi:tRNA A-37 threonylcarbamoyl transferase component Bud32
LGLYRGVQVVVKQIHYEPCPVYRFPPNKLQRELSDYAALRAVGLALPRLIGYNDSEQFLVKEFIGGQPIDELIARGELTPQHFEGIFHICDQVYGRGFNLDFFPSNFILRDGEMYYVDFECNEYSPQWDFEHWGVYFWVNRDGMAQYLRTGDHKYLSRNGKPLKWGLRKRASRVLVLGKRKQGRR